MAKLLAILAEDLGVDGLAKQSPRAWLIMTCIQAGERGLVISLSEIAERTGKSKPTASRMVESLVQEGLIFRRRMARGCVLSAHPEIHDETPHATLHETTVKPTAWHKPLVSNGLRSGYTSDVKPSRNHPRNHPRNPPLDQSADETVMKRSESPKPHKISALGVSELCDMKRSRNPPPPPPKRLRKIKEGGGKGGCSDEAAAAVKTVWEIYAAKRRECLEGIRVTAREETLTATRRRRITGLLVEKGPKALLEAIAKLHRSDWHLGQGRFDGQRHRLFTESVFSANERADQVEILRDLDDGPPLWEWESQPMSLEQRRLQAPLLAHRQMELPEVDYENRRAELIKCIPEQFEELRCQVAELDLSDLEEAEDRLESLQYSVIEAHRNQAEDEIQELRQGEFYRRCSPEARKSSERQTIRRKIGLPVLSLVI